jgi:hypothetical protein
MAACPFCLCEARGKHPTKRRASVTSLCANPATCWQWDHTCWGKRMRSTGKRGTTFTPSTYTPATLRGVVVSNVTIAA